MPHMWICEPQPAGVPAHANPAYPSGNSGRVSSPEPAAVGGRSRAADRPSGWNALHRLPVAQPMDPGLSGGGEKDRLDGGEQSEQHECFRARDTHAATECSYSGHGGDNRHDEQYPRRRYSTADHEGHTADK